MGSAVIRPLNDGVPARAYTLLESMYPGLAEADYHSRLRRMQAQDGYELHGLFEEETLVGVVGFVRLTNLIYDDYVWVHDLVIDPKHRGRGLGSQLMEHVHELASAEGRSYVVLAAHIGDDDAHRFYERHLGYERRGVLFRSSVEVSE